MNICKLINKIGNLIDYTMCGKADSSMCINEVSLPEAFLIIVLGGMWVIFIMWWLAPIQFVINKLHLRDIKFKCDD